MTDTSGNPDLLIAAALKRSGAAVSCNERFWPKAKKKAHQVFAEPGEGAWVSFLWALELPKLG
jgi:hypothetical protein